MKQKVVKILNEDWEMDNLSEKKKKYLDDVIEATLKACGYNELDEKIGKMYAKNCEADLADVGEATATHFGYL